MLPLEQTKKCRNSQGSSTKGRSSLGNLALTKIRFGPPDCIVVSGDCSFVFGGSEKLYINSYRSMEYSVHLHVYYSVCSLRWCHLYPILMPLSYGYYTIKRMEYNQARCEFHMHPHMHQIQDPLVPLCTVPQTQVPTYSLAQRSWGNKGPKQWYYLPNSSTTPKTVFGTWFLHPLKYVVSAPNSGYQFPIGYLDIAFSADSKPLTADIVEIVEIGSQCLIGCILLNLRMYP